MTWLDSTIGWLFPRAGLQRARARAALGLMRAYEGAGRTRRTENWRTSGASANTEISSGLALLRARSRSLVRDNPYARRAIAALVGNAIGTGITLGVKNEPVRKAWAKWCAEADFHRDCDFSGLQALAARASFESGECLLLRVRTTAADAGASGVPLRIKALEGDFRDTSVNGPQKNGNLAIDGIEIDKEGRRVAFHLYETHPGETTLYTPNTKSTRVLAEDVIYLFEKERPGQLLGVPRLAVGIMRLRDLDEYQEALLIKKKIEACFAAFVSTDDDQKQLGTTTTTETDPDGKTRRVEKLQPGQIIYGKAGEEITFGEPSSSADAGFTSDALHAIAAGVGCTYEQLTGDLSGVNYSSMRGGRAEFKILVEQYRWLTFVPQVCERIFRWWEEAAYSAGKIRTLGYEHTWTPPRWEYVNPKEDVQADKEELGGGLASLSEKIRARGEDPEKVFKEIAEERRKLAELGIVVDFGAKSAKADGAKKKADEGDEEDDADGKSAARILEVLGDVVARLRDLEAREPSTAVDARSTDASVHHTSVVMPETMRHELEQRVDVSVPGLLELAEGVRRGNEQAAVNAAQVSRQLDRLTRVASADRVPVFDNDGNPTRSRVDLPEER